MESSDAVEILREHSDRLAKWIGPEDDRERYKRYSQAFADGAEALELLAWIESMGVKIEFRGGLSRSFDRWLVNAGPSKSDAVTGKTLLDALHAARKAGV